MIKSEFNVGAAKPYSESADVVIFAQVTADHVDPSGKLSRCANCAAGSDGICGGIWPGVAGNPKYFVGQATISETSSLPEDGGMACLPNLTKDQLASLPPKIRLPQH